MNKLRPALTNELICRKNTTFSTYIYSFLPPYCLTNWYSFALKNLKTNILRKKYVNIAKTELKKEIAKNANYSLICSTLFTIRHNFWTNTPQNLHNSLIINHATFLWHFCTKFPYTEIFKNLLQKIFSFRILRMRDF